MSGYDDITFHAENGIVRITIARESKLNALRDQTADELLDAFQRAEADASIRVVILSGAGRAFSAGYDLTVIEPGKVPALDIVLEEHFNPLVRHMRHARLPIISMVNGPCAGAAVGIALAGDIIMAARSAYFYEPFAGIALVPDAGNSLFLPRLIGRVRAAPAMLLGDRISADEALSWGLVWRVHEAGELTAEVGKIATKLASLAPGAVAATKKMVRAASDDGLDAQLDLERDLQGIAGRSPDMKAAIAAFFAKKPR